MPKAIRVGTGGSDDILVQSLVAALSRVRQVSGGDPSRLDRIVDRLARPPVPSGLVREVHTALDRALEAPSASTEDPPALAAEVSDAIVSALEAACLLDEEVHVAVAELRGRVPKRVGRGDARRLVAGAERVVEVAGPARERAVESRLQVRAMVREVAMALSPAGGQVNAIDWGLSQMETMLASPSEPMNLEHVRSELLTLARDLSAHAETLKQQLCRARQRCEELEDCLEEADSTLAEARDAAERDGLTGLVNRVTFDRHLLEAVRLGRDEGEAFSLVIVDVDHFKDVNDTHGHPAGDDVLRRLARRTGALVRAGDIVARLGGEEFAVLLREVASVEALEIIERVRAGIEAERFTSEAGAFGVTVSIGMATHDGDESALALYKRADKALYDAKDRGRNQVVLAA